MTPVGDRDIFLLFGIHCGTGSMALIKRVEEVHVQPKDL